MTDKQIIRKVVVGSRLHDLYNEKSDYDYRAVHMSPLIDILSPYKKNKNTDWIEGDVDNTSYELTEFCKMATQGNMTIHEILWSHKVLENTPIGEELFENKHKFCDSKRIFEASRGYASNQLNKMNLHSPNDRTPKFMIAYIRVMQQGISFLNTGRLNCRIEANRDFLKEVKWNFKPELVPQATSIFQQLEKDIVKAYESNKEKMSPDIEWIEEFILKAYKGRRGV